MGTPSSVCVCVCVGRWVLRNVHSWIPLLRKSQTYDGFLVREAQKGERKDAELRKNVSTTLFVAWFFGTTPL